MGLEKIAKSGAVWAAAAVMIFYGAGKVANPGWLAGIGIMPDWEGVRDFAAVNLPWFEVAIGLMMLSDGDIGRGARRCCVGLLVFFLPFLVYFLVAGMADCGCGGKGGGGILAHPAFGIFRNLVLAGGVFWARDHSPWPNRRL